MTLTDHEVVDIVEALMRRDNIRPSALAVLKLREGSAGAASMPTLSALADRYLAIKERAQTCQVEHDHWEGKMICGNPLPCRTHGGGR